MASWLDKIGAAANVQNALEICSNEIGQLGTVMRSYHFVDSFNSQVGPLVSIFEVGFPADWMILYEDPVFRSNDPIPDFILSSGRTMTWQQALSCINLNEGQKIFAKALEQHGLIHGIGCPLFGPNGREAYAAFSLGREILPEDGNLIRLIETIAQAGHRKIAVLAERDRTRPRLSKREHQVISWMLRGKSIGDIATIIGCTKTTTDTYVKRLYAKLDVNDRSAALLVALRNGLVKI